MERRSRRESEPLCQSHDPDQPISARRKSSPHIRVRLTTPVRFSPSSNKNARVLRLSPSGRAYRGRRDSSLDNKGSPSTMRTPDVMGTPRMQRSSSRKGTPYRQRSLSKEGGTPYMRRSSSRKGTPYRPRSTSRKGSYTHSRYDSPYMARSRNDLKDPLKKLDFRAICERNLKELNKKGQHEESCVAGNSEKDAVEGESRIQPKNRFYLNVKDLLSGKSTKAKMDNLPRKKVSFEIAPQDVDEKEKNSEATSDITKVSIDGKENTPRYIFNPSVHGSPVDSLRRALSFSVDEYDDDDGYDTSINTPIKAIHQDEASFKMKDKSPIAYAPNIFQKPLFSDASNTGNSCGNENPVSNKHPSFEQTALLSPEFVTEPNKEPLSTEETALLSPECDSEARKEPQRSEQTSLLGPEFVTEANEEPFSSNETALLSPEYDIEASKEPLNSEETALLKPDYVSEANEEPFSSEETPLLSPEYDSEAREIPHRSEKIAMLRPECYSEASKEPQRSEQTALLSPEFVTEANEEPQRSEQTALLSPEFVTEANEEPQRSEETALLSPEYDIEASKEPLNPEETALLKPDYVSEANEEAFSSEETPLLSPEYDSEAREIQHRSEQIAMLRPEYVSEASEEPLSSEETALLGPEFVSEANEEPFSSEETVLLRAKYTSEPNKEASASIPKHTEALCSTRNESSFDIASPDMDRIEKRPSIIMMPEIPEAGFVCEENSPRQTLSDSQMHDSTKYLIKQTISPSSDGDDDGYDTSVTSPDKAIPQDETSLKMKALSAIGSAANYIQKAFTSNVYIAANSSGTGYVVRSQPPISKEASLLSTEDASGSIEEPTSSEQTALLSAEDASETNEEAPISTFKEQADARQTVTKEDTTFPVSSNKSSTQAANCRSCRQTGVRDPFFSSTKPAVSATNCGSFVVRSKPSSNTDVSNVNTRSTKPAYSSVPAPKYSYQNASCTRKSAGNTTQTNACSQRYSQNASCARKSIVNTTGTKTSSQDSYQNASCARKSAGDHKDTNGSSQDVLKIGTNVKLAMPGSQYLRCVVLYVTGDNHYKLGIRQGTLSKLLERKDIQPTGDDYLKVKDVPPYSINMVMASTYAF